MVNLGEKLKISNESIDDVKKESESQSQSQGSKETSQMQLDQKDIHFKVANKLNPQQCKRLPSKFFTYKNLPPPLVDKIWLKLAIQQLQKLHGLRTENKSIKSCDNQESTADESIPLSVLRTKLRNKNNKASVNVAIEGHSAVTETSDTGLNPSEVLPTLNCNDVFLGQCISASRSGGTKEDNKLAEEALTIKNKVPNKSKDVSCLRSSSCLLVNRKRGRPKKHLPFISSLDGAESDKFKSQNSSLNVLQLFSNEFSDDNWWSNDDGNADAEADADASQDTLFDINDKSCIQDNQSCKTFNYYQEHDYYAPVDVSKIRDNTNDIIVNKTETTKFPCSECGKSFSAASTLKYHMRIHNGTLIKCTECDRGFTTKYLLKCHMRIHSGDLFMCHECGRGFTTAELLKVHSRGHTGDRPFICQVCGKAFSSASNLAQHKESHDPVKKYLCFQCGSSFSQKRCLDGHMLSHGDKNHVCNVCGKLWARKSDLSEHMRVHTGSKPYSCPSCPQRFTQASSLKRHQIVHLDTKPIPCVTCGKMFKCEDYYKRHMRKHEKESESISSTSKEE